MGPQPRRTVDVFIYEGVLAMRFMMMVKGAKDFEAGLPPKPELIEAIGKLSEDMTRAGVMLENGGLMPSVAGARVRASHGKVSVTDGPFTETKEVIGGFAIVEAKSRHDAIELGKQFMELHVRVLGDAYDGECEVRQMYEGPDCRPAG
jgi:hypothetical protein